jgi:quinoprotein glucose dehydrogenase
MLVYGLIPTVLGSETGAKLVAYDKQSGSVLGEVALPPSPLGTPMTYMVNGKQYIALTLQGGQMVALTLP